MHALAWCIQLLRFHYSTFMHAVTQFHYREVNTLSAESVGGSTPGVRVTWSTTVPPECVASMRVEFRTNSRGPVVATYTTTNTSQTEVVQTGLQCATNYYTRVVVTGDLRPPGGMPATPELTPRESRSDVQVRVGGMKLFACDLITATWWWLFHCTGIPVPFGLRAEITADNTNITVSWQWSCQGVLDLVRVYYRPEGGSLMMYTAGNTTATNATLSNLQCNTVYTIWVHASSGLNNLRSLPIMVDLPASKFMFIQLLYLFYCIIPAPPTPTEVTAESWMPQVLGWTRSGPANCFNTTHVTYQMWKAFVKAKLQSVTAFY